MRTNGKLAFIVWYNHSRRGQSLAAELGGQVSFIYERRLRKGWLTPLRYLVQGWKTWHLLEREQPAMVVVQSPPIVAALIVALWCELRGSSRAPGRRTPYAIDCHTGTFYESKWSWALPLLRLLARQAAVTIVASEAALQMLQNWQVKGVFLVDGLPTLTPGTGAVGSQGTRRVAVISSFDYDEPVAESFAAARLLPHVTFYFTGDATRLPADLRAQKPDNVILTGFLQDDVYTGLLMNVHGLVVLTTEPNILNCGTYEAMAVGRPAVLSDWSQIRRYFTRGFVYVKNSAEAIAAGVREMLDKQATLETEIVAMRSELMARRKPNLDKVVTLLTGAEQVAPGHRAPGSLDVKRRAPGES